MKELLEKIGLNDFFAYICPGLVLLSSVAIWEWPNFASDFWKQQALVILLGFVLSYALGQIIASGSYKARSQYYYQGRLKNIRGALIAFFYGSPPRRSTPFVIEANLDIAQDLEQLSGFGGLSNRVAPWDRLTIYRALQADRLGIKARSVVTEADNFQRGFLFCMGMAVAVRLLAVQAFIRFTILAVSSFTRLLRTLPWNNIWRWISTLLTDSAWLIILVVFCLWASSQLRQIGFRMWEGEIYLTGNYTGGFGMKV